MGVFTPNLNLWCPEDGDDVLVDTDLSNNYDKIDAEGLAVRGRLTDLEAASTDYDTRLDALEASEAWVDLTPVSPAFTGKAKIRKIGRQVELSFGDMQKFGTLSSVQYTFFTLPVKYRPSISFYMPYFVSREARNAQVTTGGIVQTLVEDWTSGDNVRGYQNWIV